MTAMSDAMPSDLAEAVRSLPCGACLAPRGGVLPGRRDPSGPLGTGRGLRAGVAGGLPGGGGRCSACPARIPAGPGRGARAVRGGVHGGRPSAAMVRRRPGTALGAPGAGRWAVRDRARLRGAALSPAARAPARPRGTVPLSPPPLVTGHPGGHARGHGASLPAVRPQARAPGTAALKSRPGGVSPVMPAPPVMSARRGRTDRDPGGRTQVGPHGGQRPPFRGRGGGQAEPVPAGAQAPGPDVADPAERQLGRDAVRRRGPGRAGPLPGSCSARPSGPAARSRPAAWPRPGRTAPRAARAGRRPPPRRPRAVRRHAAAPARPPRPWPSAGPASGRPG